jgi:hypothetical protein
MALGPSFVLGGDHVLVSRQPVLSWIYWKLASPSHRRKKEIRLTYSFACHGLELQRISGEEAGVPVSELVLSHARCRRCDVCATVDPDSSPRTYPAEH